jgi:hypothetical protein
MRIASLALLASCLTLTAIPAAAGTVYENGPINGEVLDWIINGGYVVTDSFTLSAANTTLTGFSFGAWLFPGDILESAEVSISSRPDEGTFYFDGVVNSTQSGCFVNRYSFDICTETGSFDGPSLANGTYYVTLQNAVASNGDTVYWDENSGIGCHSPGCPSVGSEGSNEGTIPSEAFTLLGNVNGGTTPEPSSLALFASVVVGLAAVLRRKRFW